MSYLKNKWLFSICVCVGLILIPILTVVVFQKLDLPFGWIKTCFYISFVGAGGIGVIIALYVHNIPQKEKHRRRRLEVKAWKDLGMYFYSLIVGIVSFCIIIQKGGEERNLLMVVLAIAIGLWMPIGQFVMKKRILQGLDERERLIHERAKAISDSFFAGFCLMGLLGLCGWVGLKTPIPVYIPVLIVFGLGAIAEILKPLIVLIQCKMENSEQTEGGAA